MFVRKNDPTLSNIHTIHTKSEFPLYEILKKDGHEMKEGEVLLPSFGLKGQTLMTRVPNIFKNLFKRKIKP